MIQLDGLVMFVTATAANGVVGSDTMLRFIQRGMRVAARYAGGRVDRGWLVGRWIGDQLTFRYVQREGTAIHAGRSVCDVQRINGRVQIVEHFTWSTRPGVGINTFDEVPGC